MNLNSFLSLIHLGHLEKMSALHDSQMYDVNKRLEAIERTLINKMQENSILWPNILNNTDSK